MLLYIREELNQVLCLNLATQLNEYPQQILVPQNMKKIIIQAHTPLPRMKAPTKSQPKKLISKFLIMHSFHPEYQIDRPPEKQCYQEATSTAKLIHDLMVSKQWEVYGNDNSFDSHLINKNVREVTKAGVLSKLKEMFENDGYEYLAIFLIGHGHEFVNSYQNLNHWIQIQVGAQKIQVIELRQILNLWKPKKFKHLFIALYACNAKKIKMIMDQYKALSSISLVTSYDEKNKVNIFLDGNCKITSHLFGLTRYDLSFKQILQDKEKIVGTGHHEHWVILLSESYQEWLSKTRIHKDISYKTNQLKEQQETSRYFGRVIRWKNSKYQYLKHGKGFMQSRRYYFEGAFNFGKFYQGRLYYKEDKKSLYGTRFDDYELLGQGCVVYEDKQTIKNDRVVIGHFPLKSKHFHIIEQFSVEGGEKYINLVIKNSNFQLTLVSDYSDYQDSSVQIKQFSECILTANHKKVPAENFKSSEQYKATKKSLKKIKNKKQTTTQISFQKIQVTCAMPKPTLIIKSKQNNVNYQNENYSQILTIHHLYNIFDRYCYIESELKQQKQDTTVKCFTLRFTVMQYSLNEKKEYIYMVELNAGDKKKAQDSDS